MIDAKYIDRDIWMAFPIAGEWYLMPHDKMLACAETEGFTKTSSWIEGCAYSLKKPSAAIIVECAPYRFASITDVAADAASEDAV